MPYRGACAALLLLTLLGLHACLSFSDEWDDEAPDPCGNGEIDRGEECDDGYHGNSDFHPNACRKHCKLPSCGDGIVDHGERCEPDQWPRPTCQDANYTAGHARCAGCQVDTRHCSWCGDNRAEGADPTDPHWEACDGTALRGLTCADLGLGAGMLGCTATCTLDTAACALPGACGDGFVQDDEQCDDGNTRPHDGCSATCQREAPRLEVVAPAGFPAPEVLPPDPYVSVLFHDAERDVLAYWSGREIFELRGDRWERRSQTRSPRLDGGASAAYDTQRGRLVLFGAVSAQRGVTGVTWEYGGSGWTRATPPTAPSARAGAAMTYDAARGTVVLFGGYEYGVGYLDDTWEYDGQTWTARPSSAAPSPRAFPAVAYDAERQRAVLHGGAYDSGYNLDNHDDTWEWDGERWWARTDAMDQPTADGRVTQRAVWDPRRRRVVLLRNRRAAFRNEWQLWEWDGERYREVTPRNAPLVAQNIIGMAWDASRAGLALLELPLLFGAETAYLWQVRWE